MMTKPLLLLAALTLCCCISSMDALQRNGCRCIRTSPNSIPRRIIRKIEVIPISGHCRRTEIIITRRNGFTVCVDPSAVWVKVLLRNLQNENGNTGSASGAPPASTTNI
ncbi:C-X-C motif chemokine 13 [Sebastes fasciatus]|uniref:C-X-C motif chemokine 13 n=1 Tax=Sebastes fasciatus TaxID=394691 RepID=UPI003D9E6D20